MAASKDEIIEMLTTAYNMELETVTNYLAASVNLDGVRAEEIKKSLAADVTGELGHATQLGNRIKQLGGIVPGSMKLKFTQASLQPSANTTDVVGVIRAVIEAEEAAIAQYKKIIRATEGEDYVSQELAISLQADEEGHLVLFKGFLKEYTQS
jgi:bacterioferritin